MLLDFQLKSFVLKYFSSYAEITFHKRKTQQQFFLKWDMHFLHYLRINHSEDILKDAQVYFVQVSQFLLQLLSEVLLILYAKVFLKS